MPRPMPLLLSLLLSYLYVVDFGSCKDLLITALTITRCVTKPVSLLTRPEVIYLVSDPSMLSKIVCNHCQPTEDALVQGDGLAESFTF